LVPLEQVALALLAQQPLLASLTAPGEASEEVLPLIGHTLLHSALSPTAPGLAVSFDVHEDLDAQHALLSPTAPGLADLLLLLQPFTRLMTAHSATMLRIDLIMVLTSSVRPAIAGKKG
jgi:hypothetical protein